jgi:D-lactate dehydrogenase
MKIAFFDAKTYDRKFFRETNKTHGHSISFFESNLNINTAKMAEGHDAVCAFVNSDLSASVLDILQQNGIKLIALRCAGYNNVDFHAATQSGIRVVRVPAYSPYAVAEHALALIMTLNRKTHKAYSRTRDNNFNIEGLLGFDLKGKTIGVIGTGKIGQTFIKILSGFGAKILAYDPFPAKELETQLNFNYVPLNQLYESCHIISLHCPLTSDTHHMINEDALQSMKNTVMLINTSRGGLIDTKALIEALKSKKVGSAGLDVYEEEEEYFFEDCSGDVLDDDQLARLLSFHNVLITSHQAFFTEEALTNIAETTLQNISDFESGKKLTNEICYHCSNSTDCPKSKGQDCKLWS